MCSFNLRLFTRERLPTMITTLSQSFDDFQQADQDANEASVHGEAGKASSEVGGHVGGLSAARPAVSRVLRVEPLTHTILTSPGWRTLMLTWNDPMQSWIKTGVYNTCVRHHHHHHYSGA